MFKIQEKGKPETAIWLVKENTIISNDNNGDLAFETDNSDACKVKIQLDGERIYLADLTFNFTIVLNDEKIPAGSKRALKHADQLRLGNTLFEVINPKHAVSGFDNNGSKNANQLQAERQWRLKAVGNWLDGQVFPLKNRTIIGRDKSCDITIPGSHLSRRHAEFMVAGHSLLLRDLESANGSFVNGKQIKEATLKDGDIVKLDVLSFKIIAPAEQAPVDKRKTVISDIVQPDSADITATSSDISSRNWVTKPTSIGNRENDLLDLILARHQRNKRIIHTIFGGLFTLAFLFLLYILLR